ncbi:MAG: ATP-binding protein [Chitinophagales bacterium]
MPSITETLQNCGLLDKLDASAVAEVSKAAQSKTYAAGNILVRKGEVPPSFMIIHKGKVGVYNEDVLLAELGACAIIGESFIADSTATATLLTLEDTEVLSLEKDTFFGLIATYPRIMQNLFSRTMQRLLASNDQALEKAKKRTVELEQQVDERTAELKNTLEELKYTQKFRDQFLANMSHEIRTPMNAIVGLTNLLVKTALNEQQEKYLQVIRKSGDNLLVIINDILDLSKIEAGKMELEDVPFDLPQAVEQVRAILDIKAKDKGIGLEVQIGEGVPQYVLGDETRITQVLMNLTGNAIKFTEEGKVTIQLEKKADAVHFSIRDTGIGIPEDKLSKIFESFGQASTDTTRKYGGTGLGLNISKQLVEMHGGELGVHSTYGKGSEFYFSIAYKPTEKPQQTIADTLEGDARMDNKKILLVEDNAFNQLVAVDTLEILFPGLQVDVADNGRNAIAKASEGGYALILMDIQLPDIDGMEITRFIRSELKEPASKVRICAMTASITQARITACMESGMDDYMYKPYTPDELKNKIISNVFGNK